MQDQDAAYILYQNGTEQKDIARILNRSEKTIGDWKKKNKWDDRRRQHHTSKETSSERLQMLIDYQLRALEQKVKAAQAENPDELKLIDKGDIDALSKMYAAVKGDERTWTDYVTVMREYYEYLQTKDQTLAKETLDHADTFLDLKRRTL
jgi:hypothetical protein